MRRSLITLTVAVLICCSFAFPQQPQPILPYDAPSKEEVMKFFAVMHVREQMELMMKTIMVQTRQNVAASIEKSEPNLSEAEKKQMDSLLAETYTDIQKEFSTEGVLEDIVPVYQKHLTRSDLQAVIDFYQSPAGQKLLKEMPAMSVEAMQVTNARSQKLMETIMANTKRRVEEMKTAQKQKEQNQ
jgi:uncharacterized protein